MEEFPCKGCTERHIGCHAECERYNEVKRERSKINEQKNSKEEMDGVLRNLRKHRLHSRNRSKQ